MCRPRNRRIQNKNEKYPVTRNSLQEFDRQIIKERSVDVLIGVDEAGRGPLAGPVVAAAAFVPLRLFASLAEVTDSKKLCPTKREKLVHRMIKGGVRFGFGYATNNEIDKMNILNATFLSMRKAALSLVKSFHPFPEAHLFIVDGPWKIREFNYSQMPVKKGDSKSLSIAAASIFAKVVRDNWMNVLDLACPGYGFSRHKGYGTREHISLIRSKGITPYHRKTFAGVKG